jgi:hypothetical protein
MTSATVPCSCVTRAQMDTYRAWHDEVRLWVEVAAEHVVAVAFQCLQAFSLQNYHCIKTQSSAHAQWQAHNIYLLSSAPISSGFCHQMRWPAICYHWTMPRQIYQACDLRSSSQICHHRPPKSLSACLQLQYKAECMVHVFTGSVHRVTEQSWSLWTLMFRTSPFFLLLLWLFVSSSSESGWGHMASEPASPTLLLWSRSFSVQWSSSDIDCFKALQNQSLFQSSIVPYALKKCLYSTKNNFMLCMFCVVILYFYYR